MRSAHEHRAHPGGPSPRAALPVRRHRLPAVRSEGMKTRGRTPWPCIALVLVTAAGLQGCELAVLGAAGSAAYSIAEDRRSSGTQFDDETIQPRTQSRVSDRFGSKVHLTVTSFNRVSLLTGEAPDPAVREEISKIALGVPGVRAVTNEVPIAEPTTRASKVADEFITLKVKVRFINSGKVSPVHAKIVTEARVCHPIGRGTVAAT